MSSRGSNRQAQPGAGLTGGVAAGVFMVLVLVVLLGFYASIQLGARLSGQDSLPTGISATLEGVRAGTIRWTTASTVVAIGLGTLVAMIAGLAGGLVLRRRRRASRADWSAKVMGRGKEVAGITEKKVAEHAKTLVSDSVTTPGLTLGVTVASPHQRLFSSWEDMLLLIAGPRTGKSTSYAIPAILDAPGAALVTSNKRDLVDATRDVRTKAGSEVWVFDPQQVVGDEPTWWWNPLSYVTDEVKAATMADHFATNSRPGDAKTDAFFEPEGKDLLANFLLAAALDGRPVTDVYKWATGPNEAGDAVRILKGHDYELQGDNVAAVLASPDKQRGGVFGTTKQMASCLTTRTMQPWVVEGGGRRRRHFDPHAFVRDGGTLYSLSREGRGNAGALVTALTNAVADAAEEQATITPGDGVRQAGRLPVPLVGVLDEAANVCRWRDLPSLYSHYGSRGIVLMTILQSYAQGVGVWGREGMDSLWTAANVAIYGGGVRDEDFLRKLSGLIGTYDKTANSVSTRSQTGSLFGAGAQVSTHLQTEHIMDAADLASLPKGRSVVLSSGNRATLVETLPWMAGERASEVRASIAAHDPAASQTLSGISEQMQAIHNASTIQPIEELRR